MAATIRHSAGALVLAALMALQAGAATDDWAVEVVEYAPNTNNFGSFLFLLPTNATLALGHAATTTWDLTSFVPVRVFCPPLDVVTLGGYGGSLTLKMGGVVSNEDDPIHMYGIDLIVYGNAFFGTRDTSAEAQYSLPWLEDFSQEPAEIWVSPDCTNWFRATNCVADALMPAQSLDLDGCPSDYLKPIDPSLLQTNWFDMTTWSYSNTVPLYGGAAGGAPVDLSQLADEGGAPTSIPAILYVKLVDTSTDPIYLDDPPSAEIDAVARVADAPEPAGLCAVLATVLLSIRLFRTTGRGKR